MITVLEIFVIVLAGYIAYLHFFLAKQNLHISSLTGRLSEFEKTLRLDEIRNERLFDERSLKFILEKEKEAKIYIHYTMDFSAVKNILVEGFRFSESFYKTALAITSDRLDLLVKHNDKKYYGDYIVVICIATNIVRHYNEILLKAGIKNHSIENILTDRPPEKNENSDLIYILPVQYVKGYLNHRTGEIITNDNFDPSYNSPQFESNLLSLMNSNN